MSNLNETIDELRTLKLEIHKLRKLYDNFEEENIRQELKNIIIVSDKIYKEVAQNSEKISRIKNFANYYILTVEKILTRYHELKSKKILTRESKELFMKIEEFLPRVNDSFNKMYESLFANEIVDIDTEIQVMLKEMKL